MHISIWLKTAIVCVCARTTAGTAWDLRSNDAFALLHNQAHLASPVNLESSALTATTAVYDAAAGLGSRGAVTFNRAMSQFVQGAPHDFLIADNGFTAVMVVMFTGTAGGGERILDFGNGIQENIVISRWEETDRMIFSIANEGSECSVTTPSAVIVKDQWLIIIATYELSDNRLRLRVGNTLHVGEPCDSPRVNRVLKQTYVGKGNDADVDLFTGRIAGLYAVAKTLSRTQVAGLIDKMYTGNDLFCQPCNYECDDGSSIDVSSMQCTTTYNSSICVSQLNGINDIALVRGKAHFASRANRDSTPQINAGKPVFQNNAGPGPSGHQIGAVVFNSQYLDAGAHTMQIEKNGFTAVAVFMFTGVAPVMFQGDTVRMDERLLDFGNGERDVVRIMRFQEFGCFEFTIKNGIGICSIISQDNTILQNTWQTIVAQYNPTTLVLSLRVGDVYTSLKCGTPRVDRTFSKTYVGKSQVNNNGAFLGKIAGLYVVDRFLSKQEISGTINDIYLNNDLFNTWCGHTCEPGYSIDMVTMACTLCPTGWPSNKGAASTHYCNGCTVPATDQRSLDPAFICLCNGVSSTYECSCAAGYTGNGYICTLINSVMHEGSFTCVAGYTGIDGHPCAPCAAGTFKRALGSAECSSCPLNSISGKGSVYHASCQCIAGFTGKNGALCMQCAAGKQKAITGSRNCEFCPLNQVVSTAFTNCECGGGSITTGDSETCGSCGAACCLSTLSALDLTIAYETGSFTPPCIQIL